MAIAEPLPEVTRGEDELLVERFLGGDAKAFEELVRRHQRPVFHLARRFVRDDDTAKDLAQRAFVKAYQGISSLQSGAAFRTWLLRIVSNLALNHIRDRGRERLVDDVEDSGADIAVEAVGTDRLADAERRERLLASLAALPPRQKLVLELRVFQEMSFREVAQIAGCTENAAKVNFHHAVKRLREVLSRVAGRSGEGAES